MRDVAFGQYYPASSVLHRLDARVKILLTAALIAVVFMCAGPVAYGAAAAFVLFVILLSRVPLKSILRSLKGVLFLALFMFVVNLFFNKEGRVIWSFWRIAVTDEGLLFSLQMIARLVLLIIGTTVLTLTTTPMSLTDGLESLLKPLTCIKVPVHDLAVIMSIALRFIPTLMEEIDKIMLAQKARGAAFDTGGLIKKAKALLPVLIPLFVSAFRRADELALALDARCYNATPKRTKYRVQKVAPRDIAAGFVMLAFGALIYAVNHNFWA